MSEEKYPAFDRWVEKKIPALKRLREGFFPNPRAGARRRYSGLKKKRPLIIGKRVYKKGLRKFSGRYKKRSYRKKFRKSRPTIFSKNLRNVLCDTQTVVSPGTVSLNNIVTAGSVNKADWFGIRASSPNDFDGCLTVFNDGTSIASVPCDYKVLIDHFLIDVIFKNNFNHEVLIDAWMCYPRRDLPSGVAAVTGVNPALLTSPFADATIGTDKQVSTGTGTAITYYDPAATPYMSPTWCSVFNVKPYLKRCLQPGEQFACHWKSSKNFILDKRKYGLEKAGSIGGAYEHLKKNGPILLVKVIGGIVHDESVIVAGNNQNRTLNACYGSYNVDVVWRQTQVTYVPYVLTTRATGIENTLANITLANEDQYTTIAPFESQPGV